MASLGSTGALPTIKCSSCGVDIDIEKMADHLCAPVSTPLTARPAPRSFKDAFSNMSINQSIPAPFRQRPVLQPIDSTTANTSFRGRTAITPNAQTSSYTTASSNIARKSPYLASHQNGGPFPRAPSPELSLPQDSAFPLFPLPSKTKNQQKSNIYTAGDDSNNNLARNATPEPVGAVNNIPPSRQQYQQARTIEEQNPRESIAPMQSISGFDQKPQAQAQPFNPYHNPANSGADSPTLPTIRRLGSPMLHDRKKSISAANRPLDEIGSVRTHRSAASRSGTAFMASGNGQPRSASAQGFVRGASKVPPVPDTTTNQSLHLVRSASAMEAHKHSAFDAPPLPSSSTHTRSDSRNMAGHISSDSTSSNQSEASQPTTSSSRSSPPASPPRRTIQEDARERHDQTSKGLGIHSDRPVGPPAVKSFSRPRHAQPNSSISSPNLSGSASFGAQYPVHNMPLQAPGVLSPETLGQVSAGPWQSVPQQAQPSGVLSPETIAQVAAGPYQSQLKKQPDSQAPTAGVLSPETLEQVSAGPWQSDLQQASARRPYQDNTSRANDGYQYNAGSRGLLESRLNSVSKGNALPTLRISNRASAISTDFKESARSAVMPSTRNQAIFGGSPSPLNHTSLRRAATTSKGKCRGCGQAITGKSVSSADGRLTGRWHKHCFTCKTCAEPFPTMDFYVLGNDPYCNRHYHQLNKSLCSSCDRGIEGQYVENEQQKFHPHCFSCNECHLILRDTYFDLNGKIFCERHAFKPNKMTLPGPGTRFPEKRSTRLMMI